MKVRTRIAPSPTGMPHIGTIFQALINYAFAKRHGPDSGQFIVRVEDTDRSRLDPKAEKALFKALDWFELEPDESPYHRKENDLGPYRQSERQEENKYQEYAERLIEAGHAYYCFCSQDRINRVKKEMQQQGKPPMYDGKCRVINPELANNLARKKTHVIRMKIPKNITIVLSDRIRGEITFDSNLIDDQVILKSDKFPTYHLAVVVDDHDMNITHAIRGEEWISSAPKHVLLHQYLFTDSPPEQIHTPLISQLYSLNTPLLRNPDKSKLSKRHDHASVNWYRQQGYLPEAILNFLATRVWNHPDKEKEVFSLTDFIEHFRFKDMHVQAPVVDLKKLDWYNGIYIRKLSKQELLDRLRKEKFIPENWKDEKLLKIIPHIQERLVKLSETKELMSFFFEDISPEKNLLLKKADAKLVSDQLSQTITDLKNSPDWSLTVIEKTIRSLEKKNNWKKGQFFMMLRIAVTGKTATPPLFETIEVLGQKQTLDRLSHAQKIIS